jgi:hypothetical protein
LTKTWSVTRFVPFLMSVSALNVYVKRSELVASVCASELGFGLGCSATNHPVTRPKLAHCWEPAHIVLNCSTSGKLIPDFDVSYEYEFKLLWEKVISWGLTLNGSSRSDWIRILKS